MSTSSQGTKNNADLATLNFTVRPLYFFVVKSFIPLISLLQIPGNHGHTIFASSAEPVMSGSDSSSSVNFSPGSMSVLAPCGVGGLSGLPDTSLVGVESVGVNGGADGVVVVAGRVAVDIREQIPRSREKFHTI